MAEELDISEIESFRFKFKSGHIAKSAFIVTLFTFMTFIFNMIFQIILAKEFGASRITDIYLGASTIPLMAVSITSGLFIKTFIPAFYKYSKEGERKDFLTNVFNSFFVVLFLFSALLYVFTPQVVRVILPGFQKEALEISFKVFRLFLPVIFIGGIIGFLNCLFYLKGRFALPSFAPILKWAVAIAIMLIWNKKIGVYAVVVGMLAGFITEFLILIPEYLKNKSKVLYLNFRHTALLGLFQLMLPLLIAYVFDHINLLLMKGAASHLEEGSIACLDFAYKLMLMVIFFSVQGLSITIFPLFARYASEERLSRLKQLFINAERVLMIILLPTLVIVFALKTSIIQILFERGAFTHEATIKTGKILLAFGGAIIGLCVGTIQSQVYYAMHNTKRVMKITMLSTAVFLALLTVFTNKLPLYGIALAFSGGSLTGCLVNAVHLNKIFKTGLREGNYFFFFKVFLLSFVAGYAAFLAHKAALKFIPYLFMATVLPVLFGYLLYYCLVKYVFKISEINMILSMFKFAENRNGEARA